MQHEIQKWEAEEAELENQSTIHPPENIDFLDQTGEDTDGLRGLEDGLKTLISGFDQLHADTWTGPTEVHGAVEVGLGTDSPDNPWSPSPAIPERKASAK